MEQALVEVVASALQPSYSLPNNTYQPETVFQTTATVIGTVNGVNQPVNVMARAYRGWPVPSDLKLDLENGISEISVFSVPGMMRLTSKFFQDTYTAYETPITFTATVVGLNQVTFGGTATAGQITGIATGASIIEKAYCMRLSDSDTPVSVANALSAIIPGSTVSGSTVTVPSVHYLQAGVAGDSIVNTDVGFQTQMFDIHIWSPNPQSRDAISSRISSQLSTIQNLYFADYSMSDNMWYRGVWTDDNVQDTTEWHRYLRYEVSYPTTQSVTVPGVLFIGVTLNDVKLVGAFDYRDF